MARYGLSWPGHSSVVAWDGLVWLGMAPNGSRMVIAWLVMAWSWHAGKCTSAYEGKVPYSSIICFKVMKASNDLHILHDEDTHVISSKFCMKSNNPSVVEEARYR